MTIKRQPIRFVLESAPKDPFFPEGKQLHRVVMVTGSGDDKQFHPVTRRHDTAKDAMQVLADKIMHSANRLYMENYVDISEGRLCKHIDTVKAELEGRIDGTLDFKRRRR